MKKDLKKIFESDEFKENIKKEINKTTWDVDKPKCYILDGDIVHHFKDGKIEVIIPKDKLPIYDELSHIPDDILLKYYKEAFADISFINGSKIIITSTPNGQNSFYDLYLKYLNKKD